MSKENPVNSVDTDETRNDLGDNTEPSLGRKTKEGATTRQSLKSSDYGDNCHPLRAISEGSAGVQVYGLEHDIVWSLWQHKEVGRNVQPGSNELVTTSDTEFASYYDPVSKHQIIMEGVLGSFYGVTLLTDGFRFDTLQVLNPGEVYFLGTPKALGVVMERKPLTVENVIGATIGQPNRGWFMQQIESQVNRLPFSLGNPLNYHWGISVNPESRKAA